MPLKGPPLGIRMAENADKVPILRLFCTPGALTIPMGGGVCGTAFRFKSGKWRCYAIHIACEGAVPGNGFSDGGNVHAGPVWRLHRPIQ